MLGDRQEFEVGEAEIDGIGDQLFGEFVVGEEAAALAAPPGSQMNLEDRHRLAPRFALTAGCEIVGVIPVEIGGVGDHRGGRGPQLGLEADTGRPSAAARSPLAETISYL